MDGSLPRRYVESLVPHGLDLHGLTLVIAFLQNTPSHADVVDALHVAKVQMRIWLDHLVAVFVGVGLKVGDPVLWNTLVVNAGDERAGSVVALIRYDVGELAVGISVTVVAVECVDVDRGHGGHEGKEKLRYHHVW